MTQLVAADDPTAIDVAAEALRAGLLIAIPTETVYGVVALPDAAGVERLIAAKQRSADKGIQLLVDSLAQVRAVAVLTPAAERLAERFWPGGLTLVLDRRPECRSAGAARWRAADAGVAAARPSRAAFLGPSPRAARGKLGERLRPTRRDDCSAGGGSPRRSAGAGHRRRRRARRHAIHRRRLLLGRRSNARAPRGRNCHSRPSPPSSGRNKLWPPGKSPASRCRTKSAGSRS